MTNLKKTKNLWVLAFLFPFFLSCATTTERKKEVQLIKNYEISNTTAVDSTTLFSKVIAKYKQGLENTMSEIVGFSSMDMPKQKPESLLSNMMADMTFELGKKYTQEHHLPHSVDLAIVNIGGIRKPLSKGAITLGDIYEISPFENKLYIVALQGKDLRRLFDHITRSGGEAVSNVELKANKETRKLIEAKIGGKPLDDKKTYYIISIDYLINGGDGMSDFSKKTMEIDMNLKMRDAFLQYVRNQHSQNIPLTSKLDKRISYE